MKILAGIWLWVNLFYVSNKNLIFLCHTPIYLLRQKSDSSHVVKLLLTWHALNRIAKISEMTGLRADILAERSFHTVL